jgi:hypothetical protein
VNFGFGLAFDNTGTVRGYFTSGGGRAFFVQGRGTFAGVQRGYFNGGAEDFGGPALGFNGTAADELGAGLGYSAGLSNDGSRVIQTCEVSAGGGVGVTGVFGGSLTSVSDWSLHLTPWEMALIDPVLGISQYLSGC